MKQQRLHQHFLEIQDAEELERHLHWTHRNYTVKGLSTTGPNPKPKRVRVRGKAALADQAAAVGAIHKMGRSKSKRSASENFSRAIVTLFRMSRINALEKAIVTTRMPLLC